MNEREGGDGRILTNLPFCAFPLHDNDDDPSPIMGAIVLQRAGDRQFCIAVDVHSGGGTHTLWSSIWPCEKSAASGV